MVGKNPVYVQYNEEEKRKAGALHPLVYRAEPDPDKWYYIGFEPVTELPEGLSETATRRFVLALCRLADQLESGEGKIAFGKVHHVALDSFSEGNELPYTMLSYKTLGHLSTMGGSLAEYIAQNLPHKEGKPPGRELLEPFGISVSQYKDGQRHFYHFDLPANASMLKTAIALGERGKDYGLSYSGFLAYYCSWVKPQYTQPMLLYTGDAIREARPHMPTLGPELDVLYGLYRKTGFKAATETIQQLCQSRGHGR